MPVKNVKRQTNGGFEGIITGLNDKEKEIISKSIGGDLPSTWSINEKSLFIAASNDFSDDKDKIGFTNDGFFKRELANGGMFSFHVPELYDEEPYIVSCMGIGATGEFHESKIYVSNDFMASDVSIDLVDINRNKDEIAKAVKTNTDASLKSLTLPSANALKTKDGTSFGGSSAVYEEALSEENGICPPEGFRERYNEGKSAGILLPNNTHATFIPIYDGSQDGYFVEYNIYENDVYFRLQYYSAADNIISYDNPPLVFTLQNKLVSGTNIKTINDNSLLGEGDIKVQNVLYRHTITIYEGNTQDGNSICFTAYTASNTAISSIEQLANTDLDCFGVSGTASALVFYNKIHIGADLATTTLQKATGGSVALSTVYATYTITDEHGPLN